MINWYFALLDHKGEVRVTLPNPENGVTVQSDGTISGATGGVDIWNGSPPPWCYMIVEVKSPVGWYKTPDKDKHIIWCRDLHFHDHLDRCEQCREHPHSLCSVGSLVLRKTAMEVRDSVKKYHCDIVVTKHRGKDAGTTEK